MSSNEPDWSREEKKILSWDPSRSLLASLRAYQYYSATGNLWHFLQRKLAVLRHRFWSVVTGADIPINTQLGGGLLLPHPNGVVIHPGTRIGPNCLIFQQVTLGTRGCSSAPVIGGHVDIGAGAKILGAIKVGDHVEVGANAVVLTNIPSDCVAVGLPAVARLKRSRIERSDC